MKDFTKELLVRPGGRFSLKGIDPGDTLGFEKEQAVKVLEKNRKHLEKLQHIMYADDRLSLLVILQGIDGSGKDGTIRHVMEGFNPQGCYVTSFKKPNLEELQYDFLWRIHRAVPRRGEIGIFNRSHYEDVVAARVLDIVPKSVWSKRYKQINDFEEMLHMNGTRIIKIFLYISREEQKKRMLERLEKPSKYWKLDPEDLKKRMLWDGFMKAYEDAINKCNTSFAPWYVIPADHRWFRNMAVSQILVETLESFKLKYPEPRFDPKDIVIE